MRASWLLGLALAAAACGGPSSDSRGSSPETPGMDAPEADPAPVDCARLGQGDCIRSPACTLDPVEGGGYACRAAAGPCEEGLLQSDRAACEARTGCVWDPGQCYCPEDVVCVCGGGPPPTCRTSAER